MEKVWGGGLKEKFLPSLDKNGTADYRKIILKN